MKAFILRSVHCVIRICLRTHNLKGRCPLVWLNKVSCLCSYSKNVSISIKFTVFTNLKPVSYTHLFKTELVFPNFFLGIEIKITLNHIPVSYTHLDVYKRQAEKYPDRKSLTTAVWAGSEMPLRTVNCSSIQSAKTSALPSAEYTAPSGVFKGWRVLFSPFSLPAALHTETWSTSKDSK